MTSTIVNLGGDCTTAAAINNAGLTVGDSVWPNGADQAFQFQQGVMSNLGGLPGSSFSMALGVNSQGQVVGLSAASPFDPCQAVLWQNGTVTALTGAQAFGEATAINDGGQVVGVVENAAGNDDAFLWQNGTLTDLGTLAGASNPSGAYMSFATGINNAGQVVGGALTAQGYDHPVLWQNGQIIDLGGLAATFDGQANAINGKGQIAGDSSFSSDGSLMHAVLWQNGTVIDLGTLAGYDGSDGIAIDSAGDVAGSVSDSSGNLAEHAVLWQNGKAIDLNSLLPAGSGWVLNEADGINDQGQIVGQGTLNGVETSFLLTMGQGVVSLASAQTIVQEFRVGTLASPIALSDSAADVATNLDGLQSVAAAGLLASVTLADPGSPTLSVTAAQLSDDALALHAITGSFDLSAPGVPGDVAAFIVAQDWQGRSGAGVNPFVAGATGSATDNGVTGFQSVAFTGGYDAVVLPGARSSYQLQIAADGATKITDTTNGTSIQVTGESYLVFDGADNPQGNSDPASAEVLFIETPAAAQVAELYHAVLGRQPDLAGLEYWLTVEASGGGMQAVAQGLMSSDAFVSLLGGTPSGDSSSNAAWLASLSPNAFVSGLYQYVLNRAPDAAGLAYWRADLAGGDSQANVLLSFATSAENAVKSMAGASDGGWLVDPGYTGGYADAGQGMAAQTVLPQAEAKGFINLGLISPSSLGGGSLSIGAVTLSAATGSATTGRASFGAGLAGTVIVLSPDFATATVAGHDNTVADSSGSNLITVTGVNNHLYELNGGTDTLFLGLGTNTSVAGFTPGQGSVIAASGIANPSGTTLLDGTVTPVNGALLSFGTVTSAKALYVLVGSVGGGSAAEVAAAANKAYLVADANGNAATGTLGEHVTFLGLDAGGNTEVWSFQSLSQVVLNGRTVLAPIHGPDVDGSHLVQADAIAHVATLIGVAPTSLTVADLA
jgi:probable HAF family extracellular repeat protein